MRCACGRASKLASGRAGRMNLRPDENLGVCNYNRMDWFSNWQTGEQVVRVGEAHVAD